MSKISNIIKENSELKIELEKLLKQIKENDIKHKGFKLLQLSFLTSDTLEDISEKALSYAEQIFDLENVTLFIKKDSLSILNTLLESTKRIKVVSNESYQYTFLEKRSYIGKDSSTIHPNFRIQKDEYSFVISPVLYKDEIIGALGFYSLNDKHFNDESNCDFINELALIVSISLRNLNDRYLLSTEIKRNN